MSYVADEAYDVYTETLRCAAKNHKCDACGEKILKGTHYFSIHCAFDGSANTIKRCKRCQTIHLHLRTLSPGDMWPDEELNCGEEYREHWGKEPPPEIAALAFERPEDVPLPLKECRTSHPQRVYMRVGEEWIQRECSGDLTWYTSNIEERGRKRFSTVCNVRLGQNTFPSGVATCHGCNHHPDGSVTFSPLGKVSHQRCYGCGMVRYARADGTWWPWQRESST